jgi:hypothetical protein
MHDGSTKRQFVIEDFDLLVVGKFAGARNPDLDKRRCRVSAEKDSTHAPRTVGRVCDARVVFRVFHDNQAARAVYQQLGVEVQPM